MSQTTVANPSLLQGLSSEEAAERFKKYGPNALQEKKKSTLLRLLSYFWGPIPWMIEIAAILSAAVQHWPDFGIIMALLIFNAGVGFWQEFTAGNAVEALKKELALKARVLRDGQWREINSPQLVPDDVVRIRLGDIIPADVKIIQGDYLSVDQAALTGESLPVSKNLGDEAYSGTVVKQGEVVAQVIATGAQTKFGKTASLVGEAKTVSHFQKAVLTIGDYLIYVSLALVLILILFQLHRDSPWLELLQFALILTVASIPVAMPAVLSMTMAVGAMALSKRKAIVTRLESIEEMASMDVLCSDKTGTLTQNRLTLGKIELFHAEDEQSVLLAAALASKAEDKDAIDQAIIDGLTHPHQLGSFHQASFIAEDTENKRSEATIDDAQGKTFKVTRGVPKAIIKLAKLSEQEAARAYKEVDLLEAQGFQAVAVAIQDNDSQQWRFLGIFSLFDSAQNESLTEEQQSVLLAAALASKEEGDNPLDKSVLQQAKGLDLLNSYQQLSFTPFDPVHKRTEATVKDNQGLTFKVTKGAPQIIMQMSDLSEEARQRAQQTVDDFAAQGYRALGVARKDTDEEKWQFLGIVSLFDPPREDSAQTIAHAKQYGVSMKMVTGDNQAIAIQIANKLGLGSNILPASSLSLDKDGRTDDSGGELIEQADGFAEVYPEHKFGIVKLLQSRNHITGMTGDGVNDAPALKQADVGIAVSGATDAARAAADLVLTAPGLSVIIKAIEEARRIFERMNAYAIYRISETIRIMFFVVLTMIFFNFYPITAIMIILLAFFNDVPIMTIAYDHTALEQKPVRWDMRQVITVATAMGIVGVIGSFGMLLLAMDWLKLDVAHIQTYVFLKMAVAGHLVLFVARSKDYFWKRPWPAPIMVWSAVITKIAATILAAYGFGLITPISWPEIGLIWGYSIVSALVTDFVKVQVYHHFQHHNERHKKFIKQIQQPIA